MSTHGIIARGTKEKWKGRFHGTDAYPDGLGQTLWLEYRRYFNHDIKAMTKYLIDDHPAGWSCIVGFDFTKPAGRYDPLDAPSDRFEWMKWYQSYGPQCYCHGPGILNVNQQHELLTSEGNHVVSWLYVIEEETRQLHVFAGSDETRELYATIDLDNDEEPDWEWVTYPYDDEEE